MKCPHCGQEHPDDTKFCPQTGKKIESRTFTCVNPACNYRQPLPLSAKFCPNCGNLIAIGEDHLASIKPFNSKSVYDEIEEYHDGLAKVRKNWKYGFIDEKGQEVIPCKYEGVYGWFENGFCIVQKNSTDDLYGVIDKSDRLVIPCIYTEVSYDQDIDAFAVTKNGHCGIISTSGEIFVPPTWDFISWYSDGVALAEKGNLRMLIDKNGENIYNIPPQYSDAKDIDKDLIIVKKNNSWGVVSRQGKVVVDFKYEKIRFSHPHIIVCQNGKEGLVSINGDVLLPCKYERIFPSNNTALTSETNGYVRIVDLHTKHPLSSYYPVSRIFDDDYIPVENESGIALMLDWNGSVVIPPTKYNRMYHPTCGMVAVMFHDSDDASYYEEDDDFDPDDFDYWGVIDLKSNKLVPCMYESLTIGDNGLIVAKFKGKDCIINQNNEMIFPNGIDLKEWDTEKEFCRDAYED